MTAPTPSYRHLRGIWMAACRDGTAWLLTIALARSDTVVPMSRATDVPPLHLRLVA